MRSVAFLTYFFPPIGGGGTPRTTKFVKYLPQYGYRPVIVGVEASGREFIREFQPDDSPLAELDPATYDVLRVPDPSTSRLRRNLAQSRLFPLAWAIAYPWLHDPQRSWAFIAARRLLNSPQRQDIRLVYVSAAPMGALEAGRWLARSLGVPWVADLRDLWTPDTFRAFPSRLHYAWAQRLERRVLQSADAIIANTPLSAVRIQELVGTPAADRVVVIPNGFDPDEVPNQPRPRRAPGSPITIVHAGTLYDPGIRRSRPGRYFPAALNDEARSPLPIARALARLGRTDPAAAARFRLRLIGYVPEFSRRALAELGVSTSVTCEGSVPRAAAVAAEQEADAQLVVQVAWDQPERPMPYVPGKVYEALATGSPVLAPVGPGDLLDLLRQTPQAYVCDYRDPAEIAATMLRLAEDLDAGRAEKSDPAWLAQFDRRHLTATLAKTFDALIGSTNST